MGDGPALTERISLLFVFIIDCWVTSHHTGMALKQHTSVIWRFPWARVLGSSAGACAESLTGCSPGVSGAGVSSEARLGMDLFHAHEVVGSTGFLVGCWPEASAPIGCWLEAALRSLPRGLPHVALALWKHTTEKAVERVPARQNLQCMPSRPSPWLYFLGWK